MFTFTFSPNPTIAEAPQYILGLLRYNIDQDVEAGILRRGFATLLPEHVARLGHRVLTLLARAPITIKPIRPVRPAGTAWPGEPAPRRRGIRSFLPGGHDCLRLALKDRRSLASQMPAAWLRATLRDDIAVARFAADPAQAIRTLCRMFGVPVPEPLRPPARLKIAKPPIPEPPKPHKPRKPVYHASFLEDLRTPADAVDITWQPHRTTPWRKSRPIRHRPRTLIALR